MAKKSAAKRLERLESICMGMGFLLLKLRQTYGSDFGVGVTEQVDQAIRDYRQIEAARRQRERAAQAAANTRSAT